MLIINDRSLGRDSTIDPAYLAKHNGDEGWEQAVAQLQREIDSLQTEVDKNTNEPIELDFIDDLEPIIPVGGVG